ncbi:MAG TPA: hypothetical protein VHW60_00565 [Caulobacteraceae bacterium]|jgi:hypothetical protein|nr:hypothetical protein [Caulobacteraceae bacterium]
MKKLLAGVCVTSMILSACASSPDSVHATYVSPLQYSSLSCAEIHDELLRVSDQVRRVARQQSKDHTRDQVAMGVGLVVFWPALFFIAAGNHKEELAELKGQYDALSDAGVHKNCGAETDTAGPPPAAAQTPPTQTPPTHPA